MNRGIDRWREGERERESERVSCTLRKGSMRETQRVVTLDGRQGSGRRFTSRQSCKATPCGARVALSRVQDGGGG